MPKIKPSKNVHETACCEPMRFPENFRLEDDEILEGVSVGDKLTLTIEVEMTGEESRNYDGKKKKSQTFQINEVNKNSNNKKAKMQNFGGGMNK